MQIARQMWTGNVAPYHGKRYQLTETLCRPMPVRQPHPPILVGGSGAQKAFRLVAKYTDACNIFDSPVLGHKLAVLHERCEAIGRLYDQIEKTSLSHVVVSPDGRIGH